MSHKNFAVILSGCGVYDGAEINEVVLSLLAMEERNIQYKCFAPNIDQHHVIDHLTGQVSPEKRNVLKESARIVRGNVYDLKECNPDKFDALIVPGGFGVAKNLSTFAFDGESFEVDSHVIMILERFKLAGKAAGYMCIAPVLLPVVYGPGIRLTVGNDEDTIAIVEKLGGEHQIACVDEIVIDHANKVVSTPAYMLAKNIFEAKLGIDKLIFEVCKLS